MIDSWIKAQMYRRKQANVLVGMEIPCYTKYMDFSTPLCFRVVVIVFSTKSIHINNLGSMEG